MPPSHANTSAKDAPLYGASRKKPKKEISSSTTLSFTSQLSSLISTATPSSRPSRTSSRTKDDIFKTHNRGSQTRAQKDLEGQKHSTSSEALDSAQWHRSKRRMEEKARLYAAMKRGDVEDVDDKYAVDFDRKWAEKDSDQDDDSSDDVDSEDEETVEWTDEFGRTRTGSRRQMLQEQRQQHLTAELSTRARPSLPSNLIYGDTVQAEAFNPDEDRARQMEELAAKRDKEVTPPPDTHFDSSKEVREKGVGFMQFSLDAEHRKKQMENLVKEREETERKRAEREEMLRDRKAEIERRRREIAEKRGKRKADEFLEGLGEELTSQKTRSED
ncbi:hypothetical protein AAFC00_001548 [Neodothiora populina]|uniref:Coiled-coil domain-containing protein n=1 Tax=Neodothiora populina TaxID=2781224 RepID=A0ABR3PPF7_9PEZI